MIANCEKCGKERHIYNPKQKIRLCMSCWQQEHRDPEKVKEAAKRWQRKNLKYYRDYNRRKKNIPKDKWRKE